MKDRLMCMIKNEDFNSINTNKECSTFYLQLDVIYLISFVIFSTFVTLSAVSFISPIIISHITRVTHF